MFGIAVARLDKVSDAEKERYQSLYCGLCRSLKERYGQVSRLSLSYDLVFLAMLFDSLYEPEEECGVFKCVSHPTKSIPFCSSEYIDYAADLSVALAFHKCLDDVADDGSLKAKAATAVLRSSYDAACERIPDQCAAIEKSMQRIREMEACSETTPDSIASEFGELMGTLFTPNDDIWRDTLFAFGFHLGRFIYLMDAAVDFQDDIKNGAFNPFIGMDLNAQDMRSILMNEVGQAAIYYERLPLVQDANLMNCVLYSGVWQKFNQTYEKTDENIHNVVKTD